MKLHSGNSEAEAQISSGHQSQRWRRCGTQNQSYPARPLEIKCEVGLHELLRRAPGAVTENQVVLLGLVLGRGKADIYVLVMGRIGGEEGFAGVAVDKVSVLIFVQKEEVDIRTIVASLARRAGSQRFVVAMQMGHGGVGGNFEGKCCRSADRKGLVQNGLGGRRWRRRDAVHGPELLFFWYGGFLFWQALVKTKSAANKEQWQETEARLLIHP